MLYRKIRWKYRYGYYKKKLKKNAKVYSLKTLVLIKKRIKARIKKNLNLILKKKKKFKKKKKQKKKKKKFLKKKK